MNPIPIGTPCYVVRSIENPDCIGRVCEVVDHGRHAGCPHCHRGNRVVGHAFFPDGWGFHITAWDSLKPIVPPRHAPVIKRRKEIAT